METVFDISSITETRNSKPFENHAARAFLDRWCKSNDSIVPQYIPRSEWQKRGIMGILEKNTQNKQTLFLPEDLRLWEMIDIIRTIDHDTFAKKPELRDARADKLEALGQTFKKAGIYIYSYLPHITTDTLFAELIAQRLYSYGVSLEKKEQHSDRVEDAQETLTDQEKQELDRWFLGQEAYQKRRAKLGDNPTPEQLEQLRIRTITHYFAALNKTGFTADIDDPINKTPEGPFKALQTKTQENLIHAITTPNRELRNTIFGRGLEKLVGEMKILGWRDALQNLLREGANLDTALAEITLARTLKLSELKAELAAARRTETTAQIAQRELAIARKIQAVVSSYPYQKFINNPTEIIESQYINCVGAALLGGALLTEVGLSYAYANIPGHAVTLLQTSDHKVYWQDFTPPPGNTNMNYHEVTAQMFEGEPDVPALIENSLHTFPTLRFKEWKITENEQMLLTLYPPDVGVQLNILQNTAHQLDTIGQYQEAIECCKQALSLNPLDFRTHTILGGSLLYSGKPLEALTSYKQAIQLNPDKWDAYFNLGNCYINLGEYEHALAVNKKAHALEPANSKIHNSIGISLFNLGKYEEAEIAYLFAIKYDQANERSHFNLALLYKKQGKFTDARKHFQKVLTLVADPSDNLFSRTKAELQNLG